MCYVWLASLLACLSVGCSQGGYEESQNEGGEAVSDTEATEVEAPSTDGAKAHVQKYIDRLLGGDESVRNGLLSFEGVDFASFDSIEITSSQQKYLESGKKVDGMFSVRMRVTGKDSISGRTIEKTIERGIINNGFGYQILGADF